MELDDEERWFRRVLEYSEKIDEMEKRKERDNMNNQDAIKKQFLEAAISYYGGDKILTDAIGKTTCFEDLVSTVSDSDFRERDKKWREALKVAGKALSADERQEIIREAFKIIENKGAE